MEFVLIIIAIVIVSVISAALKKKPKSSGDQSAPVRPTMTDIQRAFMMAAGIPDDEQNQPQPRSTAPYDRQPGLQAPAYAPYAPPAAPFATPAAPYVQAEYAAQAAPSVTQLFEGPPQDARLRSMAAQSANPFTGAQISSYVMDEEDEDQMPMAMTVRQQHISSAGAGITLFENQRDIVKALIYAEILPRRSGAQRLR